MNKRFGRFTAIVLTVALILSALPLYAFVFAASQSVYNESDWEEHVISHPGDSSIVIDIKADFELTSMAESDFSGTINGNGHVITINNPTAQTALFNTVHKGATITDLGVVIPNTKPITTFGQIGAESYRGIFANAINGTVTNCFTYGTINVTGNPSSESFVGGFCGSVMENATISNSFSCVSINSANTDYSGGFAGIVRTNTTKTTLISSCYSSGFVNASAGDVAGFANIGNGELKDGLVQDCYTSSQIVNISNDAKPSGVNCLYDNQLSLILESSSNKGLSTRDLMATTELSNNFIISAAEYPSLKTFYNAKWSDKITDIVSISVTAAAFSDVDPSVRYEINGMIARADYLTLDTYIDRTNHKSTKWSIDSENCKIYDAVPLTTYNTANTKYSAGTSADLIRSRYQFNQNSKTILTASLGGYSRQWRLTVSSVNPFYNQSCLGTVSAPFEIDTKDELDYVRHYTLHGVADYSLIKDLSIQEFDPIVDFQGVFKGNNHTLHDVTLADDRKGDMGVFANTLNGSKIQDLVLSNVNAVSVKDKSVGALIGSAVETTVSNIVVKGSTNKVSGSTIAGGVIGTTTNCKLEKLLISCETDAPTAGGLVGSMKGGTLTLSGSTGLVGGNGTVLGGLIGSTEKGTENVKVSYCYSTAMVLSNAQSTTVAGLIGKFNGATLTNSYSAALAASKNTSGVFARQKPLVGNGGNGSVSSGCYYDGQFYDDGDEKTIIVNGTNWTTEVDGHYPQLACFSSAETSKQLSLVSTDKFIYQHYWKDSRSDDATTAFIPNTYESPTVADAFCEKTDVKKIYTVENTPGYGFEPASGVKFAAVRTVDSSSVGVRYAATIRDDLIPLTFEVQNQNSTPVFISIAYSSDKTNWKDTQLRVESGKAFYDIPTKSYIRVRVWTQNELELQSIQLKSGSTTSTLTLIDGEYISTGTFSSAINVIITLRDKTSLWGVQRDTV